VTDPVSAARAARESLAKGLQALQSDPNVPKHLVELAAPIAQAMGALHQIEKSNGTALTPHADLALNNTRGALAQLQQNPNAHPAVAQALEAVAASLGQVHQLSKMAQGPALSPTVPAQQAVNPAQPAPAPAPQAAPAPQPAAQAARPATAPMQAAAAPAPQPVAQARPQQGGPNPYAPTQVAQAGATADPFARPQAAPAPAAAPPPGGGQMFNADLGAHSVTNFYKGLSGNDIIDHGGLFVSTYMVPKIGTPVRLKVSLPGGYEFEANAVVKWAREANDGSDAPPGFGAQFTQITPEARQLVYRYVRNREPLFHDDL
jgi:uncharacterized protein (TIGR02266 family)